MNTRPVTLVEAKLLTDYRRLWYSQRSLWLATVPGYREALRQAIERAQNETEDEVAKRRGCAGCGCAYTEKTRGCNQCSNRHSRRRKRPESGNPLPAARETCQQCGDPIIRLSDRDRRLLYCGKRCRDRHANDAEKARRAAAALNGGTGSA